MEAVFLKVLNMSFTAGFLVLAVVLLRLLLAKAPKWIRCALWILVGIRLVVPFSFESVVSLLPSGQVIPEDFVYLQDPYINSGIPLINDTFNPILSGSLAPQAGASANPAQIYAFLGAVIWLVGIGMMGLSAAVSYLRIRYKVREAAPAAEGTWICDHIGSPFILGLLRPRIYLPSELQAEDASYVVAHEKAHLCRKDHLWKPLGFLLLSIHWFNPLLWLAYILLCRDIELACDEKVIRQLGEGEKKPYSQALINCSVPRRMICACPLAFGEVGVKGRIRSVLNYKKPAFWVVLVAVIALTVSAVCLLTDPVEEPEDGCQQTYMVVAVSQPNAPAVHADHFYAYDEMYELCKVYFPDGWNADVKDGQWLLVTYSVKEEFDRSTAQTDSWEAKYVVRAEQVQVTSGAPGGELSEGGKWFFAVVSSISEDAAMVTPMEGSEEAREYAEILVDLQLTSGHKAEELTVGQIIRVSYDGVITKSIPARICNVYSVYPFQSGYGSMGVALGVILYDVDQDGITETCGLGYGPTSGLASFMLTVWEGGQIEYHQWISGIPHGEMSFQAKEDGSYRLCLKNQSGDEVIDYYDFFVRNGNLVVISESGRPVSFILSRYVPGVRKRCC